MRPMLRWGLGATLVASAGALWVGDKSARVIAAVERTTPPDARPHAPESADPRAAAELPAALPATTLEIARRDVFVPVEPPPPPPPPAPKPFVGPPLPPPPPAPPPMNWRYFGSMTTPAGERLVMLARGEQSALVQPGTRLDDGYVVQAISPEVVRLTYPSLGSVVDLPLPPPPPSSIR